MGGVKITQRNRGIMRKDIRVQADSQSDKFVLIIREVQSVICVFCSLTVQLGGGGKKERGKNWGKSKGQRSRPRVGLSVRFRNG